MPSFSLTSCTLSSSLHASSFWWWVPWLWHETYVGEFGIWAGGHACFAAASRLKKAGL